MYQSNSLIGSASLLLLVAVGCGERPVAQMARPEPVASSANSILSASKPEGGIVKIQLTPDQCKVREMRGYLDDNDYDRAIVIARDLMDSKDVSVRGDVVLVFGWIGKRALPELTEMLRDPESEIAQDALVAWENACEDYPSEEIRADLVAKSVVNLEDAAIIDAMLMHLVSLDEQVSLGALQKIIVACAGRVPSSRAKEMYEHISGTVYSN